MITTERSVLVGTEGTVFREREIRAISGFDPALQQAKRGVYGMVARALNPVMVQG